MKVQLTPRKWLATAAATVLLAALGGCGASYDAAHNHNANTPTNDSRSFQHWHWIDSPGSFATIIVDCIGTEGYYETPDQGDALIIVPQDPYCGFRGTVTTRVYK